MAASVASSAGCGMSDHAPSGVSHCPVSARNTTAWSESPRAVSVSRTHFALKYALVVTAPRLVNEPLTSLPSRTVIPRVTVRP